MNSNDTDFPNDNTLPAAEAGDAAAPKRKRAPAKPKVVAEAAVETAVETAVEAAPEAPAAVSAEPKPRAPRKTAAKKPAPEVAVEAVVVEAVVVEAAAAADEAPKKRAPRKKAEVLIEPVVQSMVQPMAEQQPLFSLAPEAPVAVKAEAAPDAAVDAGSEEGAEAGERSGRNRNRRRGRKDRVDGAPDDRSPQAQVTANQAPAPELLAAVGERFADVLAGAFDAEDGDDDISDVTDEVVGDDEEAQAEPDNKRVLAPEPDAPKLQKVLAQAGVGSRRDIEDMIAQGKIEVNGEVAHIGQRISFGDNVRVAGKPIRVRISPPTPRILAYHKPTGEVVTFNDPEGRPTVFRHLPKVYQGKWQSVGRLDLNTEGLLLFTNSGELANQLMHPRFNVEREYAVRVLGTLNPEQKAKLLEGVIVEGQKAAFKSIEDGGGEGANHWYRVVITEGRNREVRKLFDTQGLAVSRLIRIRYGTVVLPRGLKRGVWIELGDDDVRVIRRLAGGGREERPERQDRQERGPRNDQPRNEQQRGDQQQRPEQRADQPRQERGRGPNPNNNRRSDGRQAGVGPRPSRGQEPRAERPPMGADRVDRNADRGPDRTGDREYERPNDRNGNVARGNDRPPRDTDDIDEVIPHNINPLEQTFDRRFATKGGRGVPAGFGPGGSSQGNAPAGQAGRGAGQRGANRSGGGGGGAREPDPMQTSVGYIGADAFVRRSGRSGGGGGRGGQGGQGGGGGGGGRSGGGYGGGGGGGGRR